jgi:hypothetical protein
MSCCNNTFPCGETVDFKIRCVDPCANNKVHVPEDINYIDLIFNPSSALNAVPSSTYFIPSNVDTVVPFNTVISHYGTSLSPDLLTGIVTINDTGLYQITYEVAWNNINYSSVGASSTGANANRLSFICIGSPLTSIDQVSGNTSDTITDVMSQANNLTLSQNGSTVVSISAGATVSIQVQQIGVDSAGAAGFTNLLTSLNLNSDITLATRVQILKVK